ncbi:hypothetical protein KP509_06G003000 [Ceratopteris richardii]|uniref:Retrovirus-related Pol polyprotein from transposon TNT 1-94-like beta-barrel domain-containing protein n=1 Tax=Ceratopteris richardii TaxID=49495 RepID=A0A8T2UD16_CERRI|nr:hypothetical protein KP509_06G003000 [Ceratopteris richardii]
MGNALSTEIKPQSLTFEEFSALLMEEELELKAKNDSCKGEAAFMVNAKGTKTDSSKDEDKKKDKKKFKGERFHCKKKGHKIQECCIKKAEEKSGSSKSGKGKEVANTAETELKLFVTVEEICSSAEDSATDGSWLLDSGASRHITSRKDLYNSRQPLEESIMVKVGNNARCLAKGKGTMSFINSKGDIRKLRVVCSTNQTKFNFSSFYN